jgi:Zn-dependent metalloprotease
VQRVSGGPAVRPERQVVHESFADVLSVAFGDGWLWGDGDYPAGDPLIRDLAHPTYATVRDIPSPDADGFEPHTASETLSSTAVRVADAVGREAMRDIWFSAATKFLDPRSGPAGAARAVQRAADSLHGAGSAPSVAVHDAWAAIGLDTRY